MTPAYWDEAKAALSARDPALGAIIGAYQGEALRLRGDPFQTLARSITGQQISVKAADSIWNRVATRLGEVTPAGIAQSDIAGLRGCGLSPRKAAYMQTLAAHFLDNPQNIALWAQLDDDAVIAELTALPGIGRWTAEMFLIFGLGRPDVFPLGDIGLLKAVHRHYNGGEKLPAAAVIAIGEGWRPWRSVATWYLWRALDPAPVTY